MKIVIPIFRFGSGGGNRVLSELANYWERDGHQVTFLALANSAQPRYPTSAAIIWVDRQGHKVSTNIESRHKTNVLSEILALKRGIEKQCQDTDILLANQALTAYSVRFAKSVAKKFYYVQADEAGYEFAYPTIKNKISGLICRYTYNLKLNFIVNSPIYFNLYGIKAISYIPPGIDYSIYDFSPKSINKKAFRIGCIGRFEIFKGTLCVYNAFIQLKRAGYPVKLWVAFGALDEKSLQFKEDIEFFYPQSDSELSKFYKEIDILVSPGTVQFYAHHYPVMEAMSCGTPTITTGYLPADLSNSWLVPPQSSDEIVRQVLDIVNNPDITSKKINLAYSNIAVYKWSDISRKFIQIFSKSKL